MIMLDDTVRAQLQQPAIVRFSTITPAGYPHTVPVWFMLDGDDLVVFAEASTQKVKNARANPRANIAIGGDPPGSPCYLIEGDVAVEDDPEHRIAARITRHYESLAEAEASLAAWRDLELVVLRLKPRRVIAA
jgi:PPOX class probable F420-dependent enzyme